MRVNWRTPVVIDLFNPVLINIFCLNKTALIKLNGSFGKHR